MNYSNFSVGKAISAFTALSLVFILFALPASGPTAECVAPPLVQADFVRMQSVEPEVVAVTRRVKASPTKKKSVPKRKVYARKSTQENMSKQQVILIRQTKTLDQLQKSTRKALNRLKAERGKLKPASPQVKSGK